MHFCSNVKDEYSLFTGMRMFVVESVAIPLANTQKRSYKLCPILVIVIELIGKITLDFSEMARITKKHCGDC